MRVNGSNLNFPLDLRLMRQSKRCPPTVAQALRGKLTRHDALERGALMAGRRGSRWWQAAALLLVGCAVTRSGSLSVPGEERSIPVTVNLAGSAAEITGFDPVTGERFEGTLSEDTATRRPIDAGAIGPPIGGGPAPIGSEGIAGVRDTTINLTGSLRGDRGTELLCALQVEKRALIRGAGTCRPLGAIDDEGKIYRLSF